MIRTGLICILILLIAGAARLLGILPFLIILGGIVAYLGDLLGSYFGKRKLSLFGLRPKSTGTLISLMTGFLITIATLGGAMLISEDYKDALLGFDKLKADQKKLEEVNATLRKREEELVGKLARTEEAFRRTSRELKEAVDLRAGLVDEIEELRKTKDDMLKQIESLKQALSKKSTGLIVITKDQDLLPRPALVSFSVTRDGLKGIVEKMVGSVKESVNRVGIQVDEPTAGRIERELLAPIWDRIQEIRTYIEKHPREFREPRPAECVLRPLATQNLSSGERIEQVNFDVQPNLTIFSPGEEIARTRLDGSLPAETLLQHLFYFENRLQDRMLKAGVSPESLSRRLNSISVKMLMNFSQIVARVQEKQDWVNVRLVATEPVHAYGEISALYQIGDEKGNPSRDAAGG